MHSIFLLYSTLGNHLSLVFVISLFFFFFNDTATTEIYTLSLHDALPISRALNPARPCHPLVPQRAPCRSEEHTSELQSRRDLVCRLLLEKKKNNKVEYQKLQKNIKNILLPQFSIKR